MGHIQVVCFLMSYLVAWGLELSRLFGRIPLGRIGSVLFTAAGLVAHTSFLIARSRETNLPPLLSSTQDWLLVLAWLMIVSYLFLTTLDRDLAIGVFLLPIICVLIGTTYFVSRDPNTRLDALRGWKMLHASLLVLGMLGVTVGFVLAMMYLVQQYRLKHRQLLQEGFRIPSLEKLARLNRWSVMISVPLLTLGMGIGVGLGLYSRSSEGADAFHFTDPIVIGSGLVWLGMVALFTWLLTSPRHPGKQVASLTLWAGGFLLVTLLGLQVLTGQKLFSFGSGHAQLERPLLWPVSRPSHTSRPKVSTLRLAAAMSRGVQVESRADVCIECRVQRVPLTLPSPARGEGVAGEVVGDERGVVWPASLADASGYSELGTQLVSFKLHSSLFKLPPAA
ncbi:MAG TPA: cytochrome c biogenesis protein CcsA [Planctomycetaceae bacterium]|nr:cytochrome c biogenesis protein CcsA [Planctomycetaceae bacterium]